MPQSGKPYFRDQLNAPERPEAKRVTENSHGPWMRLNSMFVFIWGLLRALSRGGRSRRRASPAPTPQMRPKVGARGSCRET